jgi:hypothetical protein
VILNEAKSAGSKCIFLRSAIIHGALNLTMAIGYRTRIFDVLEYINKPVTILEIAPASGVYDGIFRCKTQKIFY